jgi:hypothetical protein
VLHKISLNEQVSVPKVNVSGAVRLEKQYRDYARAGVSGVSVCEVGHLYSNEGFAGGCPVCRKRVESESKEFLGASGGLR